MKNKAYYINDNTLSLDKDTGFMYYVPVNLDWEDTGNWIQTALAYTAEDDNASTVIMKYRGYNISVTNGNSYQVSFYYKGLDHCFELLLSREATMKYFHVTDLEKTQITLPTLSGSQMLDVEYMVNEFKKYIDSNI